MAIRFGVGLVIVRLHVEFKFVTKDGASSVGPIKHDRFADMCDFKLSHRIRQARPTGLKLLGRRSLWIARDHSLMQRGSHCRTRKRPSRNWQLIAVKHCRRRLFAWFEGVIARAEGGSGQSLTLTRLPA